MWKVKGGTDAPRVPAWSLVLYCAALLAVGIVVVIPTTATAAPPLCNGEPATIVGTTGDDVLRGTAGDDVIVGLDGDDLINSGPSPPRSRSARL